MTREQTTSTVVFFLKFQTKNRCVPFHLDLLVHVQFRRLNAHKHRNYECLLFFFFFSPFTECSEWKRCSHTRDQGVEMLCFVKELLKFERVKMGRYSNGARERIISPLLPEWSHRINKKGESSKVGFESWEKRGNPQSSRQTTEKQRKIGKKTLRETVRFRLTKK